MDGGQIQRIATSRSPVCSFHLCKKVLQNENFNGKRGVQPSCWCLTRKPKFTPLRRKLISSIPNLHFCMKNALLYGLVDTSHTTWEAKTHTGWHPNREILNQQQNTVSWKGKKLLIVYRGLSIIYWKFCKNKSYKTFGHWFITVPFPPDFC